MKIVSESPPAATSLRTPGVMWLYPWTVAVMALTGFGQMPIYNRYYLSDIPGFGWLADFYMTRYVHYIGAAVLLAVLFYAAFDFIWVHRKRRRLTATGYLRLALVAGIVSSGSLIVIKNFPQVHFSTAFVIGINLFHLSTVMLFLFANLVCLFLKKRWTQES